MFLLGLIRPLINELLYWQVLMGLAALSVVEEIAGAEDGGMEAAEVAASRLVEVLQPAGQIR